MTTICVKDNVMYGDGQCSGQHISSYSTKKIVNLGSAIVGGAGRWSHVVKFHQWVYENLLVEEAQKDHPLVRINMPEDMVDDDFTGLVLYPDGTVLKFEGCHDSFEVEQPIAIGSGADFAISCLYNDLSGEQAIETASYLDPFTGGEIQVESFAEHEELTEEEIRAMPHEELLKLVLGEDTSEGLIEDDQKLTKTDIENLSIKFYGDVVTIADESVDLVSCSGTVLKLVGDIIGMKYPHNIGTEKLRQKVLDFLKAKY
jgi:ATP-dependent protease HslVU (ClpYQ) peptidase subunit